MDAKNLFGINSQNTMPAADSTQEKKQMSETYQQWGHRMAGRCDASIESLDPHLQIVYTNIKKEQEADAKLQEQLQQDIQKKILSEKSTLVQEKEKLGLAESALKSIKSKIDEITDKIDQLKGQVKRKNSEARANLIIGLFILVPLTLYLFLFYSSTAYSAFFKEIDYTQALGSHMFDAQALFSSWQQSWTAGLFVLLITFIFMALGFILHQFSLQEGCVKYIKVACVIIITFVFDTLLAFMIAKNMYDAESLTIIESRPAYTLSMAFVDVRFWVVIFCGFLAYIIWGLLFGFVMESYNKLDLNKVERKSLEKQLDRLNAQQQEEARNQASINGRIHAIEGNIATLEASKSSIKRYDITAILLELNNFFSGWLHYMNGASKPSVEIANANTTFDTFTNNIKSIQS